MEWPDIWEVASYVVTVVGLPFAIAVYFLDQRKERDNEEEEAYQLLSDAYNEFLKVVLENADLKLLSQTHLPELNDEQRERMRVIFEMLISLFERAYIVAYDDDMSEVARRRWNSWEDYMRHWARHDDFYHALPLLLRGEDPEFSSYIRKISDEERALLSRNTLANA
ncbi:MAG: hypothetical protein EAZ21_14695 [Betaproteobacteria bacterium]|nr:MAG: hypothetical protein EAZ21_14695 [Betaproteobacteria bacterium]